MKTSLIAYRVADFLKQHPPFRAVRNDDLLPLAHSGKVVYHSEDELVCTQDQPCKPWFWVIQQGGVELIDESTGSIRDLLSTGDIFGADPLAGTDRYTYTARTTCDVILYALDIGVFSELRNRSASIDRYLRALLSVQTVAASTGQNGVAQPAWLPVSALTEAILKAHLVCLCRQTPIAELAAAMLSANCHVAAITNAAGFPLGIITDVCLRATLAGGMPATTPVGAIMRTRFPTAPLGYSIEESILTMMRERESFVVVTTDGSYATPVEGVITETTVQLLSGISPSLLIRRTKDAESFEELAAVRERVYAFVAPYLQDSSAIAWFSEFLTTFLHTLTARILALCIGQDERECGPLPPASWCWVFFGVAARGELLTPIAPAGAFVLDDSCTDDETTRFEQLAAKVIDAYAICGVAQSPAPVPLPKLAQTSRAWKDHHRKLLEDPGIYWYGLRQECPDRLSSEDAHGPAPLN